MQGRGREGGEKGRGRREKRRGFKKEAEREMREWKGR